MMNAQFPPVFPIFPLAVCLLSLLLFGIGFNSLVRWSNDRGVVPVSFAVVIGVIVTLLVPTLFFVSLKLFFWQFSICMLLCFVASGTPMIWGNVHRHVERSHKAKRLGNHAAKVRDEVVMDLNAAIRKIVAKDAEVVDVVHTLHEVIGSLKSL